MEAVDIFDRAPCVPTVDLCAVADVGRKESFVADVIDHGWDS